jgi:hypothetical protein
MNDRVSLTQVVEQMDAIKLQFETLESAHLDPAFMRRLAEAVHYAVVVFDDWLCLEYGFNRKGRGKYDRST